MRVFAKWAAEPTAPREARDRLEVFAARLPEGTLDDARLVVSELVTNAIRHAPTSSVEVRAAVNDHVLRIEVADEGPGFEAKPEPPIELRDHGYGLFVVDQLADRWGVESIPDDGAVVWAEMGFAEGQP